MARKAGGSGGKKPRQIAKGAVGPVTKAPVLHKSKIQLPGQTIPGNKVPKSARGSSVKKNPHPIPNTTGSAKIKGKTVGY
jgi:hypothetical protein